MIHERPGVWSAFGAQGTTELTDRRLAAVIAPADAAEGVQLVHSAAEAVSLYGGNALLTRMLKLCLANCGDPVYAVAVDEDTKVAYETALTALFAAAKPGVLIVGSAREDVQLLLRETAEANECLGVAGMKGASADALVARAKALCCARIVLTGPDVLAQDEARGLVKVSVGSVSETYTAPPELCARTLDDRAAHFRREAGYYLQIGRWLPQ